MASKDLALKLLELIPDENTSIHQLVRQTGWDHRTVKRYLELIIQIQSATRIRKVHEGFRVLVKKESNMIR